MMWSKLKKELLDERFSEKLGKRVNLNVTRYTIGSHWMARGWITVDGEEIANFSTPDNYNKYGWSSPDLNQRVEPAERTEDKAVEKGEFSRYEFLDSCFEYLHISLEAALESENPIQQSFAMLDRRMGKRRLQKIVPEGLHPLVQRMWRLRCEVEGIRLPE